MITHQLSHKGKAAADVAEVAKHLNITYDVRDAENAGGIAECSHIMEFTVCHGMCRSLDEFIKSRSSTLKIDSRYGLVYINIKPQKTL